METKIMERTRRSTERCSRNMLGGLGSLEDQPLLVVAASSKQQARVVVVVLLVGWQECSV